jgi:hypothetical protein
MSTATWIVGNMHVVTRDVEIVREFYRRMRKTPKTWLGRRKRGARRKVYREALRAHHANQKLCRHFHL